MKKKRGNSRRRAGTTSADDSARNGEAVDTIDAAPPARDLRPSRRRRSASDEEMPGPSDAAVEDEIVAAAIEEEPRPKRGAGWEEIFGDVSFRELGLRNTVLRGLDDLGFQNPTKIQAEMIPAVLEGRDVLGQSRTGSGKTAAFGLPAINNAIRGLPFQTVVLAPTRELAIQITNELRSFAKHTPIRVLPVYGGQKIVTQAAKLEREPEIIIATPGRLMDMVDRGYLHLDNVRYIMLDEVDRMLDIGFRDDIKKILGRIKTEHQTIFVSATISPEIEQLARTFMRDDVLHIRTSAGSLTVSLVKQYYFSVEPWDKRRMLKELVGREAPELALVFCRTKRTVDNVSEFLTKHGVDAVAIHGDLPQSKRNRIIERLRAGKLHVLVASDLAARGLDVDGITHVVNYDLPEDPEIYVHRIGRTARAGRGGVAFSFVASDQGGLLTQIEVLANTHIEEREYDDFRPGPVPSGVRAERAQDEQRTERLRKLNRYSASPPPLAPRTGGKTSSVKFPGVLVPTKLPPKRLGGKVKTARSMKREATESTEKSD